MDLLLTDEQRLLQDSAAKMLAQAGGVKRTRGMRGNADGYDHEMLERMGHEGWLGLLVEPDDGGLGLGLTELALIAMEAGRVLAPEPVAICAAVAGAMAGSAVGADLAGRLIEGRAVVAPVLSVGDTPLKASSAGGAKSWRIDGVCDGVPLAGTCDGFLVAAEGGGGSPMFYVPRAAPGLTIAARPTVDGRPLARLELAGVAPESMVAAPADGAAARTRLVDLLLFAQAAELVGVMSAALDITVEYIKTRKQFGKPIGSFQALQHRAVNDYAKMISARSFVFQVAAQGPTISTLMAAAVKAHAVAEALEVTKSAIQMHGGIGFTEDCDIGLFLKRAMWHSAWLGNAAEHRARYAAAMA